MKITKAQLKKLIEQELKEVEFGLTSPRDARIQAARAKKKKEEEELGSADTEKVEPVRRSQKAAPKKNEPTQQQDKFNTGSIRDMSDKDRQLYNDAQRTGEFAPDPEKMRLAVIRLLRNKYNL
mgnify:CR=1 FL=1